MGSISSFDLSSIITKYNIHQYIETGTGVCECLAFASNHKFEKLYSIEIYEQLFNKAKEKFAGDDRVILSLGNSFDVLPDIVGAINDNVLFWLDAHFPGADFHFEKYNSTKDVNVRLPLHKELKSIADNKDITNDVFIIDDLRIYEDGNYEDGNWKDRNILGGDGIGFIEDIFKDTHNITKDNRHQGYLIVEPNHD